MKLSWSPVVIKIKMEKKDAMLIDKSLIENFAPKQAVLLCMYAM